MLPARPAQSDEGGWEPGPEEILLGVDIVELVSSSMYVEPLTAYREYVQNSADAIDDARAEGLLTNSHGRIDIVVDPATRTARIRDNGIGLRGAEFLRRLTAFGGSDKRGTAHRGFRGVGRLAAVGYCQELIFRSRTAADEPVHELRWDCRLLKSLLRSRDYKGSLSDAVRSATSHRTRRAQDHLARFFEVELRGVLRLGKDDLVNESAIRNYLGQVAPVPFAPSFRFREQLDEFLGDLPSRADLHIFVNGVGPVYRLHGEAVSMRQGLISKVTEPVLLSIPGVDGGVAAKGWVLHHEYLGAIPRDLGVRGLRLRSGNIQVGDDAVLDQTFAEPRFNAWAVGEFHILDTRIVPNGRRDQYEHSVHFTNVLNQISPVAREISSRCRSRSEYRQLLKRGESLARSIDEGLAVLRQGAISVAGRRLFVADLWNSLERLERISNAESLLKGDRRTIRARHGALKRRLERAATRRNGAPQLKHLSPQKRRAYEEVFELIFSRASDVRGARELVGRALRAIGRR